LKEHQEKDPRSKTSSIVEKHGVLWGSRRFYGGDFTASQSSSLCTALSALETRGLVICYRKGKKRVTRVKLTKLGRYAISKIYQEEENERRFKKNAMFSERAEILKSMGY